MISVGTREIILMIAIVSSAHTSTNVVVTKEKKNDLRKLWAFNKRQDL